METILKIRMARKQAEARLDGRFAVPQQQGTGQVSDARVGPRKAIVKP